MLEIQHFQCALARWQALKRATWLGFTFDEDRPTYTHGLNSKSGICLMVCLLGRATEELTHNRTVAGPSSCYCRCRFKQTLIRTHALGLPTPASAIALISG